MTTITAAMVKELRERSGAAMMACKKALQEADGNIEKAIDVLRKAGEVKAAKRAGKTAAEGVVVVATTTDQKQAFMIEINCETDFVGRDQSFNEFAVLVAQRGLAAQSTDVASTMALSAGTSGSEESLDEKRKTLISTIGENIQLRRTAALQSSGIVGHYIHGQSKRIGVIVAIDQADPKLARDIAMHIAAANPNAIDETGVSPELIAREKEIFVHDARKSGKSEEIIEKMIAGRLKKYLKEVTLINQPFVKTPEHTVGDLLQQAGAKVEAFVRFEVGEGIEKETQDFAEEVMAQVKGNS